jgi:hypothetical protein
MRVVPSGDEARARLPTAPLPPGLAARSARGWARRDVCRRQVRGPTAGVRRHPSMANMLLRESRVDRLYGLGQSMGAPVDALRHSPYTGAAEATIPPPLAPVSSRIRHQHGHTPRATGRAHGRSSPSGYPLHRASGFHRHRWGRDGVNTQAWSPAPSSVEICEDFHAATPCPARWRPLPRRRPPSGSTHTVRFSAEKCRTQR